MCAAEVVRLRRGCMLDVVRRGVAIDGRWRAVGVGGSESFAVVGVGREDEVGSGRADVDAEAAF